MTDQPDRPPDPPGQHRTAPVSRRRFLGAVGGLTAGAAAVGVPSGMSSLRSPALDRPARDGVEPFYGAHQGGVTTSPQSHTYFASLDVTTDQRGELAELLRSWTAIIANLTSGRPATPMTGDPDRVEPDSGEALELGPARLTVNIGFGPGLFGVDGPDRFGLAARWPVQLVALPVFPGDALSGLNTGGDLTVHACADDPQVAFHAVRQLVRAGAGVTSVRWSQAGFNETLASRGTPRNLMGFKDGTSNPASEAELATFIWTGPEAPAWMAGGTYLVMRRIRVSLEQWDTVSLRSQERVIGRHKASGAPLGKPGELDALDLDAKDAAGRPVIPLDAHVRLASPEENWGVTMLRRSYAYSNGVVEQGDPGRQAPLFDAGVLFASYQRDPRLAFIPIFRALAESDALSRFTTHTGSAIAAVPPAPPHWGCWLGQPLFD
ncbi:MAG: Dyp-type peroxidase [Acidimicrobiales bacterium]|jgi:deferrochelatase/peroxidase EfeB